jgi:uncharacterized OB-fold protein
METTPLRIECNSCGDWVVDKRAWCLDCIQEQIRNIQNPYEEENNREVFNHALSKLLDKFK